VVQADGYNTTIGEGSLTIDNDATDETALTITSDATTSGGGINLTAAVTTTNGKAVTITADGITTGDAIFIDSDASGMTTGNFLNCYNGSATVFEVGLYGAATIAGNASTDVLTLTAGDIQLTNGDIDLDNGQLMVDTTQDLTSNITRNQSEVHRPAVEIEETNSGTTTYPALFIDQNSTSAAAVEIDTEGGTGITFTDLAATGDGIVFSTAASYTGQLIRVNDTLVGTAGEGVALDIHNTGSGTTNSPLVRLDTDTGTPAGATNGFVLQIDDDTGARTTSYAVSIDSANNEALLVSTGRAEFDEMSQHDGGIDVNEDVDIDFNAADEEINITNSVELDDDLAQVTISNTDSDLTDGDLAANMYLLRLEYTDDGDADGAFIVCEDNGDDEMFVVDAGGEVTAEGDINANGNITGDGGTEMVGVIHDVVSGTSPQSVTLATSGTVYTNSGACDFNLPADPTGGEWTFTVGNASVMKIVPDAADTIIWDGCGAGDSISSSTVGDTITLLGVSASSIVVKACSPADGDYTADSIFTDTD
jgi:hypothetical protein